MLLLLIACHAAPDAPESTPADTVETCPAARVHHVLIDDGAPEDVVVQLPSGALVAPWVQFQADRILVRCPDEGGTLIVGWRD